MSNLATAARAAVPTTAAQTAAVATTALAARVPMVNRRQPVYPKTRSQEKGRAKERANSQLTRQIGEPSTLSSSTGHEWISPPNSCNKSTDISKSKPSNGAKRTTTCLYTIPSRISCSIKVTSKNSNDELSLSLISIAPRILLWNQFEKCREIVEDCRVLWKSMCKMGDYGNLARSLFVHSNSHIGCVCRS